jgi:DNA repair exonuclease SbcCD ATPase subunit
MSEPFSVSCIELEGFRGANKKTTLRPSKGLTVITGPNGSGKTTLTQSMEWVLFGNIPHMDTREFRRQDAVANAFHRLKKSSVSVTLASKTSEVVVERQRSMQKSTTSGETHVTLEIDGKKVAKASDEIEEELCKLIGVNQEEFYAGTYLHQETVRDIILGPPETRTVIIDRLLGIHYLKEIADGIPLAYVKRALKSLQERIDEGEEIRENITKFSKESLETKKEELRESGITADELKLPQASKSLVGLNENLVAYAETAGVEIQRLTRPPTTFALFDGAYNNLKEDYARLRKQTNKASQQWIDELSKLKPVHAEYQALREKIPQTEARTKLDEENHHLESEITTLRASIEPLRTQSEELRTASTTYPRLAQEAERARTRLEQSEKQLGTKTQVEQRHSLTNQEAEDLHAQIETFRRQLDDSRLEYSEAAQTTQQLNLERSEMAKLQASLETVQQRLSTVEKTFGKRSAIDQQLAEVSQEVQKTEDKLSTLRTNVNQFRLKRSAAAQVQEEYDLSKSKFDKLKSQFENLRTSLETYTQRYGQTAEIERNLSETQTQIAEKEKLLQTTASYDRLLTFAFEYVEQHKQDTCPICKQGIEHTKLLEQIGQEMRGTARSSTIEDAKAKLKDLSLKKSELEDALRKITPLARDFDDAKQRLGTQEKAYRELETRLAETDLDTIRLELVRTEQDLEGSQTRLSELIKRRSELENASREIETKTRDVENARGRLEASRSTIADLEAKLGKLNERQTRMKMQTIQDQLSVANTKLTDCTKKRNELENLLRQLTILMREREDAEQRLQAGKSALQRLRVEPADQPVKAIAQRLEKLQDEISGSEAKLADLSRRQGQLQSKLAEVNAIQERLDGLNEQLKRSVGSVHPEAWGKLSNRISDLESKVETLSKSQEQLELLEDEIERTVKIAAYLADEESYQKQIESLPDVQKTVKKLHAKREKLTDLESALSTIAQVAASIREDMAKKSLSALQGSVKEYFKKLHGHGYYSALQLQPETERGKQFFSLVGTSPDGKNVTYLQTRFSNAQLNMAALSLFLAFSEKLPGRIGFTILDDPSQSLDPGHRKALASLLAELSKQRQVIVTTQDEDFLEMLEKACSSLKVVELSEWTTEGLAMKH